jgi:clan AA aspartic protease (TIGR02281 family)
MHVEHQAANAKQYLQDCFRRRAQLTRQLTQTNNVKQHNRMVAEIHEIEAEITRLENGEAIEQAITDARAAASAEREKYTQSLLDARALVGKIDASYQVLASDAEVSTLLAEYNEGQARELKLGPARTYAGSLKTLAKLEEKILSETIELRREGRLFYVDVVFNGDAAQTREMAIDTGASIVSLPFALAKSVGLEPTADSEVMQMQMADGSVVPAHKVFAKEMRIGQFVAQNVECVVMPAEFVDAAPLLGQTFLENFGYKIDSDQRKLVMTQIAKEEAKPARGAGRKKQ